MRNVLRVLAGLTALFLIGVLPFTLLVYNGMDAAANRENYKASIEGPLLQDTVAEVGSVAVVEILASVGVRLVNVDNEVLAAAFRDLLPPEYLDQQADLITDAVFDYLDTGDLTTLDIVIDASPIIPPLQGETGKTALRNLLAALPVCDNPEFNFDLFALQVVIDSCLPAGMDPAATADILHLSVTAGLGVSELIFGTDYRIPINLLDVLGFTPEQRSELVVRQWYYSQFTRWAWLLWLLPLAALFLLVPLVVRSPGDWGHWWGWPLLAGGLLTLLLTFILPPLLGLDATWIFTPEELATMGPSLRGLIDQVVADIEAAALVRVRWQAGGAVLMGLLLGGFGALWSGVRYWQGQKAVERSAVP